MNPGMTPVTTEATITENITLGPLGGIHSISKKKAELCDMVGLCNINSIQGGRGFFAFGCALRSELKDPLGSIPCVAVIRICLQGLRLLQHSFEGQEIKRDAHS